MARLTLTCIALILTGQAAALTLWAVDLPAGPPWAVAVIYVVIGFIPGVPAGLLIKRYRTDARARQGESGTYNDPFA